MTIQIQVPNAIQDLFIEAKACSNLSDHCFNWIFPSPKALYYTIRRLKVEGLAWRSLKKVFPEVDASWAYDYQTGRAYSPAPFTIIADILPKKTRKPRAPKAVVAVAGAKS